MSTGVLLGAQLINEAQSPLQEAKHVREKEIVVFEEPRNQDGRLMIGVVLMFPIMLDRNKL